MKIQIASDLHLEFAPVEIKNRGADVLVLAGDIICAKYVDGKSPDSDSKQYQRYHEFFSQISGEFENVVWVAGNHEFYGHKWQKALEVLDEFASRYRGVHFLENRCVDIDGVPFLGSTLWTDLNRGDPLTLHLIRDYMNDYKAILDDTKGYTKLKPYTTALRHRASLEYMRIAMDNFPEQRYVVVSHHAPSYKSVPQFYKDAEHSNHAYASNLSEFMLEHEDQIALWVHGHMHDPVDYEIGKVPVMSNPRGYLGYESRAAQWNGGELIVEI